MPEAIPFLVKSDLSSYDFRLGDLIVDGLLGIGFSGGKLRENTAAMIRVANDSGLPIVALDLPSGIDADSGEAAVNGAIKACVTLTFGRPKPGLFLADGYRLCGRVRVVPIGLDGDDPAGMEIFTNLDAVEKIPHWQVDCHKNSRGRVLVRAGSEEYPGAAALCTLAALKSGAGLVRCLSDADLNGRLCNAAIYEKISSEDCPEKYFNCSDVLVCGCGWGRRASAEVLSAALDFPGTLVLDADALNFLSSEPSLWKKRKNVILTPHPGEAARLMRAWNIADTADRIECAEALAEFSGAVIVLKGFRTVVAAPGRRGTIVAAGNAVLAAAGSGDVLAGTIGALAAQGLEAFDAACLGAFIHGVAGEEAEKVLIADELPDLIAEKFFQLQNGRTI